MYLELIIRTRSWKSILDLRFNWLPGPIILFSKNKTISKSPNPIVNKIISSLKQEKIDCESL